MADMSNIDLKRHERHMDTEVNATDHIDPYVTNIKKTACA